MNKSRLVLCSEIINFTFTGRGGSSKPRNPLIKIRLLSAILLSAGLLFANAGHANLLTNGNFDALDASGGDIAGATGWTTFGSFGGFTTSSASGATSPVAYSSNNVFKAFGLGDGATQSFAASAGETYAGNGFGQNFSGDALGGAGFGEAFLQIVFRDGSGGFAGTAAGGSAAIGFNVFNGNVIDSNSPQDVWHLLGVGTAPAPDNTATVDFNLLVLAPSGGAGFFDSTCFAQTQPNVPPAGCPLPGAAPAPATLALFSLGLAGLGFSRRKRITHS